MLSYQHIYHAGNAADVHKHALLSVALDYMARKAKPMCYVETHAGRAMYDLSAPEAVKTGEAAAGIGRMEHWFGPDHPYARALAHARALAGPTAYPGSPRIAQTLLRDDDPITLAELHPRERAALQDALPGVLVRGEDGPAMAKAMVPPTPRRGLLLIDPSYELKSDWTVMPTLVAALHRRWNVGVLMLWYPVLANEAHLPMVETLDTLGLQDAIRTEVSFPPARPGHGLLGSGLYVVNPPYGWADAAADLARRFAALQAV
jgi:23S rRNA (adenine2030-N6)-methyltransferase